MTASVVHEPRVLADVFPGERTRDVVLIVASAAVIGLSAQVAIPLPFTPVPFSLATLTVLLAGASLGPVRGGLSLMFYLAAGVAGMPWFAQQRAGWDFPSFGYIIGFVVAAAVVGGLARRGGDRTMTRAAAVMVGGHVLIYAAGVPWLMRAAGVGLSQAVSLGVLPFLIGDAVKVAFATLLLPAAWKIVTFVDRSQP